MCAQIETWTRRAAGLTLRWLPVLTVTDDETMRAIRADWRLRPMLGEMLSPHHVVVQGARADGLLPQRAESLDGAAKTVLEKLRQTLEGQIVAAGGVSQDEPEAIRYAVETAQRCRASLTIEYFSPARGESTIRTIEPILLYSRNGTDYVEAYCQRGEDARTFRIDRIVRIVEDGRRP